MGGGPFPVGTSQPALHEHAMREWLARGMCSGDLMPTVDQAACFSAILAMAMVRAAPPSLVMSVECQEWNALALFGERRIGFLREGGQLLYHLRRNLLRLFGRELRGSASEQPGKTAATAGELRDRARD